MIDIHSHILYDTDDGANSIEESIAIIKELISIGYDSIILTPHYIKDSKYAKSKNANNVKLNKIKDILKENNIDVNLYLGNEIYIDDDILSLLKKQEISTLSNSKYILIEIPLSGYHTYYKDIFRDLIKNDYKVILAHPERYYSFQKDFNKIVELYNMGVLLQGNINSIIGQYGKSAKKVITKLLKNNMLTFLSTDIHRVNNNYNFEKVKNKTLKYISIDYWEDLTTNNARKIIG